MKRRCEQQRPLACSTLPPPRPASGRYTFRAPVHRGRSGPPRGLDHARVGPRRSAVLAEAKAAIGVPATRLRSVIARPAAPPGAGVASLLCAAGPRRATSRYSGLAALRRVTSAEAAALQREVGPSSRLAPPRSCRARCQGSRRGAPSALVRGWPRAGLGTRAAGPARGPLPLAAQGKPGGARAHTRSSRLAAWFRAR